MHAQKPRGRLRRSGPFRWYVHPDDCLEAAAPLPLVRVMRTARTPRDGAGLDVAEIDVPAVGALGVAAAGEDGHGVLKGRFSPLEASRSNLL